MTRWARSNRRPGTAPKTRARRSNASMNKMEQRYANHLELRRRAGEVYDWKFEPMKLRLAWKTWYTADFFVQLEDGQLEVHECKGHWEDDARVKIKVAASLYPCFRFLAITEQNGMYDFETIPACAGDGV